MQLEHEQSNVLYIKNINENELITNCGTYKLPCIIKNDEVLPYEISSLNELSQQDIEKLCAINSEIIIVGTGMNHQWPSKHQMQKISALKRSFDFMTNEKAAYTFNILRLEDRNTTCIVFSS